ncbi:MAG: hypothetical protein ABEN55_16225 [Bradymonadaceae bacterium]
MSYSAQQDTVDRWIPKVTVDSDNHTVTVVETVSGTDSTIQFDLTSQEWMCFDRFGPNHDNPQTQKSPTWKTGFDGLYREIRNQLNASTNGTGQYFFEWVTPSQSPFPHPSTVRLRYSNSSLDQFKLDFSPSGSIGKRFFGFNPDETTSSTITSSTNGDSQEQITGRHTAFGFWTSPHFAAFKRSFEQREIEVECIDFDRVVVAEWESLRFRPIDYQRVAAIHTVADRARKPEYADIGELDWWDKYNAFETYWDRIKNAEKFVIFHGSPFGGSDDPSGTTNDWNNASPDIELCSANVTASSGRVARNTVDVARMVEPDQMESFREAAGMDQNREAEYYPIEIDLIVDPDQRFPY